MGLENINLGSLNESLTAPAILVADNASAATARANRAKKNRVVKTACRACIANCGVLATVENGRVVKLEGNPEDPMSKGRMCAKGLSGIQALYHPNRNKYPLQRVGERGGGKWRRITWDEALTITAKQLMKTRAEYGAEAVFGSTGGGGNPEVWSVCRFCNVFGTPNWFEPGCAQCYLPRVLVYEMMYGGTDPSIADSNALELFYPDDTPIKALVLWGTDPAYSCPASGGRALVELRARGLKTVVIDPRLTADAAKADIWLPVRPGTDVALQLGWIRYIMANKLYDEDFVLKWSNLPYLVDVESQYFLRKEGYSAAKDGDTQDSFMIIDEESGDVKNMPYPYDENSKPALDAEATYRGKKVRTGWQLLWDSCKEYTLEKTAEICGVDAQKIEEAIRLYTDNLPSAVALGVATDQTPNSVQAAMGAATIDILMGNVEKKGTLMQRFRTSGVLRMPNYPVPQAAKMLPDEQLKKRLGGTDHKGLHIWWAGHPPSILDAILTGKPYPLKVWLDRSGNKFAIVADAKKWEKAIANLDFIMHVYMYPTSLSAYADIIFPAEEWLETNMIVETCNTLVARQQVVHLWETVDETLFWSLLAKKCADLGHEGCQKAFDAEYMGADLAYWDSMESFFNTMLPKVGHDWQSFIKAAPFEFLPRDKWQTYEVYKQPGADGRPLGFKTPSKKMEVYLESMIELGRTGKPFSPCELPPVKVDYQPLPYYLEPVESPLTDTEFPLTLTSGRVPLFHHSTLRNVPGLREMFPAAQVEMCPDVARQYGIAADDWVWVESRRGKIRGKAVISKGIRPGTVFMERFWNPETLNTETHGWKEMNVNVLTKVTAPHNDVVGTYTLRAFQVKIAKADGPPDGVWTDPKDFTSWLPKKAQITEGRDTKDVA